MEQSETINTEINNLVCYLYSSGWLDQCVNNVAKRANRVQKEDLQQYMYLYILEHPDQFLSKNNQELKYYLTKAIKNQYNDLFRANKVIFDSELVDKLAYKLTTE